MDSSRSKPSSSRRKHHDRHHHQDRYTAKDLAGLTVNHDIEAFKEGEQVVLTLKDKSVLDDEDDILENVNLVDEEKAAENNFKRLKKDDYNPYDEYDPSGKVKNKEILSKYDEAIDEDGYAASKKKSFKLAGPILEEEPDVGRSVASCLQLAAKKGYLEKETKKLSGAKPIKRAAIEAQSYTIEEKFYDDDRKSGGRGNRDRQFQEVKDREDYQPDIKLEYTDDSGRVLDQREAFRYLSHKFHGKGPGKNKIDKRLKKLEQESKMKQMSSIDTPLGIVAMMQAKQKELQTPYIILNKGK